MAELRNKVVVVTGASSGIGRATALEFAAEGASLVLAARRVTALDDVAAECRERGAAEVIVMPTDVTDENAMIALAREAVVRFGRIDVWVNNAAVAMFARLEDAPMELIRRVVETNFFGYVHGARAVMPQFKKQGAGILVNVDSVTASAPQPYTSAYVASKYAIRGFFECIRMELELDKLRDVHICNVMPAAIDTPLFQQAANFTGRETKALDPVYPPEKVARAIVRLATKPQREVIVGAAGKAMAAQHAVAPRLYEKSAARMIHRNHFQERLADPRDGNLFYPMTEFAQTRGGWRRRQTLPQGLIAAAAVGIGLLFVGATRKR